MKLLYVPLIAFPLVLGGCAAVETLVEEYAGEDGLGLLEKASEVGGKVEDATLGNAMKALPKYCKVPKATRKLFRERANSRMETEGNQIGVWCAGDAPLTLGEGT